MSEVLARITIRHYECPVEQFSTEDGQGFPDGIEAWDDEVIHIESEELEESGMSLNDYIQSVLEDNGLGEWDGGKNAYDPDRTTMDQHGMMRERFALVEIFGR